jgi:alpha-galactosidase
MGWNSYNVWGTRIDQPLALAAAHGLVDSGLIEHGYSYVNLDDGWQGLRGGPLDALQPDLQRFPNFQLMIDQSHAMGLKVGIYSSPWVQTYANRLGGSAENPQGARQDWPAGAVHNKHQFPFEVGHYHFTTADAHQYAQWGIDYLKYDWGPVDYDNAKEMYDALRAQPRDIVYSLSNNHERNMFADIGHVSTVANAWRTTTDINDSWKRVADDIGFNQAEWAPFARPGHFNDADMMVVGVVGWGKDHQHYTKLTPDEQYSHVSLWALLSSPMLLGNDLTQLDPFTLSLLSNDEVIAVDQDALVHQATPVKHDGPGDIYAKSLEDGTHAVGLFNRGTAPAEIEVKWSDLGLTGAHKVRDLWRQKELGRFKDGFKATVAPHGVALIKVH